MPALADQAAEFMSKSVIIVLAGADKNDLGKARWAEIPRQEYIDAGRFCTAAGAREELAAWLNSSLS